MKQKFTNNEKVNGEMAVRSLSQKARDFYSGSDIGVYEYKNYQDVTMYAVDGALGYHDGMTFDELGKFLEAYADEFAD